MKVHKRFQRFCPHVCLTQAVVVTLTNPCMFDHQAL